MDFSVWKDIILENGLEEFAFAFNARPPPLGFILIKACAGGQYGAQSVAHIKRKGRAHLGLPKGERSIKEAEKS